MGRRSLRGLRTFILRVAVNKTLLITLTDIANAPIDKCRAGSVMGIALSPLFVPMYKDQSQERHDAVHKADDE
jgi:hypothetical protein